MTEDVSEGLEGFASLASVRSGLLGDDEIAEAASAMEPGTVAALIVYENLWAIPFIAAAREAGGDVIASARIPAAGRHGRAGRAGIRFDGLRRNQTWDCYEE